MRPEVGPKAEPSGATGRWLRRTKPGRHDQRPAAAELEPVVETDTELVAPMADLSNEPIVLEPTWNQTEDHWRRLVAEAALDRVATEDDASTVEIIPAPTAKVIEGRWRRLVAEVAAGQTDDALAAAVDDDDATEIDIVEPVTHAPAVIDLTSEVRSRPLAEANPIERLPRVSGDMRVMINALRRKARRDDDEEYPSVSTELEVLPGRSSTGPYSRHYRQVDPFARRPRRDDDTSDDEVTDRRREA